MLKFLLTKTKTKTYRESIRRPTRQQRRLLAAATEVAHANADYIVHHADDNGWRGITRVPAPFTMTYFYGTITKYHQNLWKYNVGECKTTYPRRTASGRGAATHTVILNNGDTFHCTTMSDVKQELKRRRA